jgi:hypothetical protein
MRKRLKIQPVSLARSLTLTKLTGWIFTYFSDIFIVLIKLPTPVV